jgi:hypothetical protein
VLARAALESVQPLRWDHYLIRLTEQITPELDRKRLSHHGYRSFAGNKKSIWLREKRPGDLENQPHEKKSGLRDQRRGIFRKKGKKKV